MASLKNPGKEVMGPPPKRQRLATGQPSTVNQRQPRKDAKMDDRFTRLVPVDNGFQPERETEVGIRCYVNPSNPGFSGTLKQRYTDFQVFEITPDGTVVHLTNDRAQSFKLAPKIATFDGAHDTRSVASSEATDATFKTAPESQGVQELEHSLNAVGDTTAISTAQLNVDATSSSSGPPAQATAEGESGAVTKEVGSTSTPAAPQAFVVSLADQELLLYYFGLALKDKIIQFYQKILLKPDAKPASFGHLLSEPIVDKAVRAQLHQDVRRIFDSRLETQMMSDGAIKIMAASRAAKRHNGTQSKQNHRGREVTDANGSQLRGKIGWDEKGGQYLHFTLYKENKDTMEVLSFISQRLHVKPKDFAFAGTKDRRAATVQRVSVFRQNANKLASLNSDLRNSRVGDFKHEKYKLELGELSGNEFIITLRDCHFGDDIDLDDELRVKHANLIISQAAKHIQEHGFLNYYGLQRFGTFGIRTDEVGLKILQGDFKGAVDSILAVSDEAMKCALDANRDPTEYVMISRDDISRALGIHLFRSTGKSSPALEKLPRKFSGESAIIRHLGNARTWNDYLGALNMISRNLKTMYVHAYQSLVWNMVASKRWESYGSKVIEGDLILVDTKAFKEAQKDEVDENGEIVVHPAGDDVAVTHDDLYERARPLTLEEAQSGRYTIFDIVLPTPGYDIEYPRNDIGDYYKEFMASERGGGLDPANMRRNQKDFSLSGSYRKLMAKVGKDFTFEVRTYMDEHEQLVETDLEKLDKAKPKTSGNSGSQYQYRGNARGDAEAVRARYAGTAQLNAWANLPSKLAADDKVAAAVADQEKEARMNIDPSTIKQPVIKDTWIQTDAENQGRRTGHKSTVIIPGVGDSADGSKDSTTAASSDDAVMNLDVPKTSAVGGPGAPQYDAVMNLKARKHFAAESDEVAGPISNQIITKPIDISSTEAAIQTLSSTEPTDVNKPADYDTSMSTEDESDGGVKLDASPQPPTRKDLGEQISKKPEAPQFLPVVMPGDMDMAAKKGLDDIVAPRLAVIIKFSLGSSQYATMALRELMKAGGVKTYKPDFSAGR